MLKPKVRRRTVSGVLGAGSEEHSTRLRESALAEYDEQTRLSAGTITNCCPRSARTTSREQPPIRRAGVLVSIVSFARAQTNNKTINAPITSLRRISVMVCGCKGAGGGGVREKKEHGDEGPGQRWDELDPAET